MNATGCTSNCGHMGPSLIAPSNSETPQTTCLEPSSPLRANTYYISSLPSSWVSTPIVPTTSSPAFYISIRYIFIMTSNKFLTPSAPMAVRKAAPGEKPPHNYGTTPGGTIFGTTPGGLAHFCKLNLPPRSNVTHSS